MLKGTCITCILKDLLKRRIFLLFVISFAFVSLFSLGNVPESEGQDGPKASSKLFSKAQAAGSVRIIVKLNMSFVSEGLLSGPQAAVDQQARIARIQDQLHEALSKYSVKGIKRFKHIPYTAMEVDSTELEALISNPLVISIKEDIPVPPTLTESVPLIKADQAWTSGSGYTGSGWTVAILDTGVDKTHSFFSGGKVAAEACFSTTSPAYSSTTLCPDGSDSQTGSGAGVNCSVTKNGVMIDACKHGTHVAGIAAGKVTSTPVCTSSDTHPCNGVAKDAKIIAIQIFSKFTGTNCTSNGLASPCVLTWESDQNAALEHVYSLRTTYNIAAVNLSLGGGRYYSNCDSESSSTKAAIDNLRSAGIATVIASGNDGYCDSMCSPACISTAVSVGATTKSDAKASYSNYHPTLLSLFAPGSSIKSSIPGDAWGSKSGTSMAAPHVTGAWAILKQKSPAASVESILNGLKNSGVSITSACGGQKPRIDVLAALSALTPNPPSGLAGSASSASEIALSWTDNSSDETGFKIERKTGASGTYSEIATVGANVTTYNEIGLSEGASYYYRVRAYNTVGNSSYSNEGNATTLPAAPSGLSASAASTSQIDLSWTDNSAGETGFKIERKTEAGGTYGEIATVGANSTTYSNTGLSASITYYYRVRAYNATGNSTYSNEAGATTPSSGSGGGAASGGGGGGGGCFIATAAYGSYLAPEVEVLRQFRDEYLISNPIGQTFVEFYYRVSPPAAEYIARSEGLKSLTRCALAPAVYTLKYPFLLLIFLSFVLVVIILRKMI